MKRLQLKGYRIKGGRTLAALTLVASLAGSIPEARAGVIDSFLPAVGPGLGSATAVATTLSANNDNVTTDPNQNTVVITKSFATVGAIDIPILVLNSDGTTEYRITEAVTNLTGSAWTAYHFAIGYGTGAGFVESGLADLVDLDAPDRTPTFTASAFSSSTQLANSVDWFGAPSVPNGGVVSFAFSIDLPDIIEFANDSAFPDSAKIFDDGGVPIGYILTLRQLPTGSPVTDPDPPTGVPEPASLLLLGAGIAGLGALGRRRARR